MKRLLPLLSVCSLCFVGHLAAADIVALCIGNNAYVTPEDVLDTPVNDARLMHQTLRAVPGVQAADIVLLEDAKRSQITLALRQFKARAEGAKLALIFYSGHGVEDMPTGYDRAETFLLPVDAVIDSADDLPDKAVSLKTVLEALEGTRAAARGVILDCCRSGAPGATKSLARAGKNLSALDESVKKALGGAILPEGTLIAFAASPGRKAAAFLTEADTNSPFTRFISEQMSTQGGDLFSIVNAASKITKQRTEMRQVPHVELRGDASLITDFSIPAALPVKFTTPQTTPAMSEAEIERRARELAARMVPQTPASAPMAPVPMPPSSPAAPAPAVNLRGEGQRVTIEKELARKYSDQALSEVNKIDADFKPADLNNLGDVMMVGAHAASVKIQALCDIAIIKHQIGDNEGCRRTFESAKKLAEGIRLHKSYWEGSGDESFLIPKLKLNVMPKALMEKSIALFSIAKTEYAIQLHDEPSKQIIMQSSDQWIDDELSGEDAFLRAIFLSRLADAQMGIGEFETAEKTFAKAKTTAEKQKNTRNRLKSLIEVECIMAASYHHAGNLIKRDQTLSHAKAVANAAKEHSNAVENLAEIAYIQILLNDRESGMETFRMAVSRTLKMEDTYEKASCLKDIAVLQEKCGQKVEAQQTLEQIKERYQGGKYEYKNEVLLEMQASEAKRHRVARLDDLKKNSSQSNHDEIAGAIAKMISPLDRCANFISLASGLLEK